MINIKLIVDEYSRIKSIRAISRKFSVSRTFVRKTLIKSGFSIMDSRSAQLAIGYITKKKKVILPSKEKAYLYGLVMGDLTPVRKSNYTLKLITHSTHKYFIELLSETFKNYGVTAYKETKHKSYRFTTYIDLESFYFLLNCKSEIIPEWITSENFFDFLAGFIDSDGSVMLKKAGNHISYNIRFFGQNLHLLNEIKDKLKDFNFDSSVYLTHKKGHASYLNGIMFRYNKNYYTLETRKNETIELLNKIPIRHPEKIMKRELIFKIYKQKINQWSKIEEEVYKIRKLIKEFII